MWLPFFSPSRAATSKVPTESDITSQHGREGISFLRETIHCEKGFANFDVSGRDALVLEDHARGLHCGHCRMNR